MSLVFASVKDGLDLSVPTGASQHVLLPTLTFTNSYLNFLVLYFFKANLYFIPLINSSNTTNPGRFGPGSFRPGLFRPIFRVGCFGLGRWVVSAHFRGESFGPGSFRPKSIETIKVGQGQTGGI